MSHFIYQYSIGLIVFSIGLFYAFKQGYVGVSNGKLKNLLALLATFLFFFVLHGYLQFAPMTELDAVPYTGVKPENPLWELLWIMESWSPISS